MEMTHKIQLGVCCIINELRIQKPPIFSSRKMIIRTVNEKGIDALKEKADVLGLKGSVESA